MWAPALYLATVVVGAWKRLLRLYRIREFVVQSTGTVVPVLKAGLSGFNPVERRLNEALMIDGGEWRDDEAAVNRIRNRSFLAPQTGTTGRFANRLLCACFTRREAILLDYLTGENHSRNPIQSLIVPTMILIQLAQWIPPLVLSIFFPRPVAPALSYSLLLLSCLYGFCFILKGPWLGFLGWSVGGKCIPRYALLPVGFDEVSRLMTKLAAVRALLLAPVLIVATIGPAMRFDFDWLAQMLAIVGGLCLVVIGHGWFVGLRFAESMWWPNIRFQNVHWIVARFFTSLLGSCLGGIVIVTFAGNLSIGAPAGIWAYAGGAVVLVFAVLSFGFWIVVRTIYRRDVVDLVRNNMSFGQRYLARQEEMEQLAARNRELRRRYGWFWFLRRSAPIA
jgi:hypothetical protein